MVIRTVIIGYKKYHQLGATSLRIWAILHILVVVGVLAARVPPAPPRPESRELHISGFRYLSALQ